MLFQITSRYCFRLLQIHAMIFLVYIYKHSYYYISTFTTRHFVYSDEIQVNHVQISPFWTTRKSVCRSSCSEVFCEKGVLKNFTEFTENTSARVSFFNKVAGLRSAKSLKKRLWQMCFPVNFVKFLRTPFYKEHLWWLLLNILKDTLMQI